MEKFTNIPEDGSVALVSNTFICEVSRIFLDRGKSHDDAPPSWSLSRYDSLRLFDLMTLIEAVVLHDKLVTLPARLGAQIKDLDLRHDLLRYGILKELDTTPFHSEVSNLIASNLFRIANTARANEYAVPRGFEGLISKPVNSFFYDENQPFYIHDTHDFYEDLFVLEINDGSFDELGISLVRGLEKYKGSSGGEYQKSTSLLRDMYYIVVSEHVGLPYWPESTRIEFSKKFPNYFDKTFRLQLYSKLAKALHSTVTEVFDDLQEEVAFIPPFTTLVFERSNKPEDVIEQIFTIRDEYSGLRKGFSVLENERRNAKSLKDRKRIRLHQRMLLEKAASNFDEPATITLQNILKYIPDVLKAAAFPTNPMNYSADLFLKPTDWIVEWWRKRPVSKLFNLTQRIERVENYQKLIHKVFGKRFENISVSWHSII